MTAEILKSTTVPLLITCMVAARQLVSYIATLWVNLLRRSLKNCTELLQNVITEWGRSLVTVESQTESANSPEQPHRADGERSSTNQSPGWQTFGPITGHDTVLLYLPVLVNEGNRAGHLLPNIEWCVSFLQHDWPVSCKKWKLSRRYHRPIQTWRF